MDIPFDDDDANASKKAKARSLRPAEYDVIPLSVLRTNPAGSGNGAANPYFSAVAAPDEAQEQEVVTFKKKRKKVVKTEPK